MPYRLLCITAHPDDESGAFGGALILSHREGIETSVLCLTDGQAAHFRGEATDSADLARMRRDEMAAACQVLGVTRHEVLHFADGGLMHEDFHALTGVLVQTLRRWRPQVVLTFGGDGGVNLHRDHITVSAVTTAAFHLAGRPEFFPEHAERGLAPHTPQKLYYSSTPFVSVRNRPELGGSPTVPFSLTLNLGAISERKLEAFMQHSSQRGVLDRVGNAIHDAMQRERYLLAAACGQIAVTDDTALFAGVKED